MGGIIVGTVVIALAVAISPMRTSAAIIVLLSDRARRAGPLYLVGFVTGISLITGLGLALGNSVDLGGRDYPGTEVSVVLLMAGLLLLGVACWSWTSRPRDDNTEVLPRWLRSIESVSPMQSLALGFGLAVVSFKNLGLVLAATLSISQADLSPVTKTVLSIAFIVVACLGVAPPVGWFFLAQARAAETLAGWKTWLARHNGWVTAVSTGIGGLYLVGKGLGGLLG